MLTNFSLDGPADGRVVLMLHGWGSSGANFDELAAHLATTYRVVRPDLPGFGGTQAPSSDWHMADYAEFVAAFVKKLELSEVYAGIGHSFGGRVFIKGLGDGTLKSGRLVLLASAGVRHSRSLRNLLFMLVAKIGKAVLSAPGLSRLSRKLRDRLYEASGSQDYLQAGPLRQIFLNTINEDLQAAAAHISLPTMLIWGTQDDTAPPADGRILAAAIPGSHFQLIEQAGHFVHTDAPDRVYDLIEDFLA